MNKNKGDKIKGKFKSGQLKEIVLATIGVGVVLGGSVLITPNFPIVIGLFMKLIEEVKGVKLPRHKVNRVLRSLEEKEIIELEKKDNEVFVKIKDGYHVEIIKYSIKSLLEIKRKNQRWSGKWFLVVFDVPEEQRNKRNYLRRFLKEIGFYSYQQSVYVFPYECEKEIVLIKKIVEGGKYISYIVADRLEHEQAVKIKYGLN